MPTLQLPREIIDRISEYLDNSTLQTARLVCQEFSASATQRLFYLLVMTPSAQGIKNWQNILTNDRLRRIPQSVIINTCPVGEIVSWKDMMNSRHKRVSGWDPHRRLVTGQNGRKEVRGDDLEGERYRAFYNVFGDLAKLTKMQEVRLNFARNCAAIDKRRDPAQHSFHIEIPDHQEELLRRLLLSLRNRHTDPNTSPVTSLSIHNLQYLPLNSEVLEDLYSVMGKIHTLELLIVQDEISIYDELLAPHPIDERQSFMTHLETDWLMPVSSRLRSLSITSHLRWGSLMGRFHGYNLNLPQLQELTLGRYSVANNDSFDWVLKQTSLQSLYLWDCQIVAYVYLGTEGLGFLNVSTCDWLERPVRAYFFEDEGTAAEFQYPLTWKTLLDRIRIELPNLSRFHFDNARDREPVPRATCGKTSRCSSNRYCAFAFKIWSSTSWIEADCDGQIPFGERCSEVLLNRHKETIEEDSTALVDLVQEVQSRRYVSQ